MMAGELLERIQIDPSIFGGMPCIRGTRVPVAVILDGLAEGLTPEQIVDHYPHLSELDIRAAAAYGAELSRERIWKLPALS